MRWRTEAILKEEAEIGDRALAVMSSFYASITGTTVLQQKAIPPRPPSYDGAIQLFGLVLNFRPGKSEAILALRGLGSWRLKSQG